MEEWQYQTLPGHAWDFALQYSSDKETANEDQAHIAWWLMTHQTLQEYVKRSVTWDDLLKQKIEMLTWCLLSNDNWNFYKTLSQEEYKARFGTTYQYYQKRSSNKNSQPMDHTYRNHYLNK
jgi:hypothetical protein